MNGFPWHIWKVANELLYDVNLTFRTETKIWGGFLIGMECNRMRDKGSGCRFPVAVSAIETGPERSCSVS